MTKAKKEKVVKKLGATKGKKGKGKKGKGKKGYHLEVQVNDLVYKGKAVSLTQALSDFINGPDFPFNVKTRTLVKYGDSKVEKQLTWPTMMAKRKFNLLALKPSHIELLAGQLTSNLAN